MCSESMCPTFCETKEKWIVFIILSLSYSLLVFAYYPYLGNPIIDSYTDFWVGFEVFHNKILYRDIFYPYGPLIPKVFSFFWSISSSPGIIIKISTYSAGLYSLLLSHKLCLKLKLKSSESFALLLFLLFVIILNPTSKIFNMITPYSWSTWLLVISVMHLIIDELDSKKDHWIRKIIFFAICALCRPLMFIPIGGVYLIYIFFHKNLKRVLLYITITSLLYLLFLIPDNNINFFWEMMVKHTSSALSSTFHQMIAGQNNALLNAYKMLSSAVIIGGAISLATYKFMSVYRYTFFLVLISVVGSYFNMTAGEYLLGIPLLNLIAIIYFYNRHAIKLVLWGVLNATLNLRFILNSNVNYHSAMLCLPVLPYIFYMVVHIFQNASSSTRQKLLFFLLVIGGNFVYEDLVQIVYTNESSTFLDKEHRLLKGESIQLNTFSSLINELKMRNIHDIQIFPTGVILYLELNSPAPIALLPLVPTHLSAIGEERIIQDLSSKKTEYILILYRSYLEYGETMFGDSYGAKIMDYIHHHYHAEKTESQFYTLYKINN